MCVTATNYEFAPKVSVEPRSASLSTVKHTIQKNRDPNSRRSGPFVTLVRVVQLYAWLNFFHKLTPHSEDSDLVFRPRYMIWIPVSWQQVVGKFSAWPLCKVPIADRALSGNQLRTKQSIKFPPLGDSLLCTPNMVPTHWQFMTTLDGLAQSRLTGRVKRRQCYGATLVLNTPIK